MRLHAIYSKQGYAIQPAVGQVWLWPGVQLAAGVHYETATQMSCANTFPALAAPVKSACKRGRQHGQGKAWLVRCSARRYAHILIKPHRHRLDPATHARSASTHRAAPHIHVHTHGACATSLERLRGGLRNGGKGREGRNLAGVARAGDDLGADRANRVVRCRADCIGTGVVAVSLDVLQCTCQEGVCGMDRRGWHTVRRIWRREQACLLPLCSEVRKLPCAAVKRQL